MTELHTEILIVGGGLGGVAAALAARRLGRQVILTEETDWLGGQLTSQAVPPDESPWIEYAGCTRSYRQLRNRIRDYYRRNYPLSEDARDNPLLNPGGGRVSRLCHEPRVAVAVIDEMLAPHRAGLDLDIRMQHRPIAVESGGDRVTAVTCQDLRTGNEITITADYILDATELGELLELGQVEHVIGAESQDDTGEPHALPGPAEPLDQQAISWCFALDYRPGEDHTIDRPADYDFWRGYQADFWPGPQLGWTDVVPTTLQTRHRPIFNDPDSYRGTKIDDLWNFRRIFTAANYPAGSYASDISLVNWPQIDYWLGPIIGVSDDERQRHLDGARQLSLSFLYWMQTEAPRLDGGTGYAGLRLRPDVVDTTDGLAKYVYVRESRRIAAEFTILEQHIGREARDGLAEAEQFTDTIGIGRYGLDLHPSTGGSRGPRTYVDIGTLPFQIPLGALLPVRVQNLLPANKNIGTTHVSNGCYRLHPIEWTIGEAAGALAAHCLDTDTTPSQVRNTPDRLTAFQQLLSDALGFQLEWSTAVRQNPARSAILKDWAFDPATRAS